MSQPLVSHVLATRPCTSIACGFGRSPDCLELAAEDAEEAVARSPEWGKAHYKLGCVYIQLGDAPAAIASLKAAAALMPQSNEVQQRLQSFASAQESSEAAAIPSGATCTAAVARAVAAKAAAAAKLAALAEDRAARAARRAAKRATELAATGGTAARTQIADAMEAADEKAEAAEAAAVVARAACVRKEIASVLCEQATAFEESSRKAHELYARFAYSEAAAVLAALVDQARTLASALAADDGDAGTLPEGSADGDGSGATTAARERARLARAALPSLLSNRAACYLAVGQLADCVADCDAAIAAVLEANDAHGQGRAYLVPLAAPVPPFKAWLRRAEAHLRLGEPEACTSDADAIIAMAGDDQQRAAALYLAHRIRYLVG